MLHVCAMKMNFQSKLSASSRKSATWCQIQKLLNSSISKLCMEYSIMVYSYIYPRRYHGICALRWDSMHVRLIHIKRYPCIVNAILCQKKKILIRCIDWIQVRNCWTFKGITKANYLPNWRSAKTLVYTDSEIWSPKIYFPKIGRTNTAKKQPSIFLAA